MYYYVEWYDEILDIYDQRYFEHRADAIECAQKIDGVAYDFDGVEL